MTLDERAPIDLNAADQDILCLVPGIGPKMAERIIAARPFGRVEDLTQVRGISAAAVERWTPFLTVRDAADQPQIAEPNRTDGEDILAEIEVVEAKVAPAEDLGKAESEQPQELSDQTAVPEPSPHAAEIDQEEPKEPLVQKAVDEPPMASKAVPDRPVSRRGQAVTRSYVGWLAAGSGLLVLVLSLLLSLGILATLNDGQIQFASPAQISALSVRLEGLETQADNLGEELNALRIRLSNLEAMGERMSAVEQTTKTLRTDIDGVAADLEDISAQVATAEETLTEVSSQVDDLQAEIGTLQAQGDSFQAFLDGLQALMDSLFRSEGGQ